MDVPFYMYLVLSIEAFFILILSIISICKDPEVEKKKQRKKNYQQMSKKIRMKGL